MKAIPSYDQGIVERGDWLSITPVRGIEKLAIGKTMDQVPKIASRVCGICPIAHTLAGVEAMEASIGCEVPKDAKLLRVIRSCGSFSMQQTASTATPCTIS